jgi:hypothetical protein
MWKGNKNSPRRGIEPRPPAWQAGILTTILSRNCNDSFYFEVFFLKLCSLYWNMIISNTKELNQKTKTSTWALNVTSTVPFFLFIVSELITETIVKTYVFLLFISSSHHQKCVWEWACWSRLFDGAMTLTIMTLTVTTLGITKMHHSAFNDTDHGNTQYNNAVCWESYFYVTLSLFWWVPLSVIMLSVFMMTAIMLSFFKLSVFSCES